MNPFRWALSKLNRLEVGNGYGGTFFIRYDLIKCRWGNLYLHEFLRSDTDRCLHDHPWDFWAFILWGGYWEVLPCGAVEWRKPFTWHKRRAEFYHRVVLQDLDERGRPWPKTWSLVLTGVKRRDWGFHGPNGWVKWVLGKGNPICED